MAWLVNHDEQVRTEIFSLLEKKGTQIMCLSCYDKHAAKNVYSEDTCRKNHLDAAVKINY